MPQPASSHALEREQLASVVRKLVIDADEFFTQQQKTLQLSYAELNSRIEQLRMRVLQQQLQLSPMHTANGGYSNMNPSLFSALHNIPNADLLGLSGSNVGMVGGVATTPNAANAMNATPMRPKTGGATRSLMGSLNGPNAVLGMSEALSESARSNGALGGYLSTALNGNNAATAGPGSLRSYKADAVTPPKKQLALSQPTNKSPSMPSPHLAGGLNAMSVIDDAISGEFFSTAPNNNNRSHHDSLMASPQATQKLSLVELIERFNMSSAPVNTTSSSAFNFDSLYEQLTGGGGAEELSQSPMDYTEKAPNLIPTGQPDNAQASPCDRHHDNGGDPSPDANGISGGAMAKNSIPIDTLRALHDQHLTTSVRVAYERGRPKVLKILGGAADTPGRLGIDPRSSCEVLVEFKRNRVLQYESHEYVAPGSYVIVGGDRGEDLGLVVYVWCEVAQEGNGHGHAGGGAGALDKTASASRKRQVVGVGLTDSKLPRSIGVGNGTVLRLASETDVQQLLGTQAELERRAIDVCAQLVLDHSLPMVIVDAEYQFDKKKLTFFYEAQQRMDFRELVRHLYKTFRARIWMELVDA
ncbi:PSP1 C-terminal conserved region containing protein, putative [Leishmania donovani]|uniref:PSP1 C-terminal conserved region containing protein, putative n=2 Tax=Leishmania donovani TaxID=5661 RepID=A0A3Q8ILF1_LEIDO|nr:PSP1 C-terminal conserved region containing protein, putative [Leishmania donovani]